MSQVAFYEGRSDAFMQMRKFLARGPLMADTLQRFVEESELEAYEQYLFLRRNQAEREREIEQLRERIR
jgi:hypothetical protein